MIPSPLLLIDGHSYLYRAYHAMPKLTNRSGEPTGALYGVVNMLRKLLHDSPSQRIAVIFDAPGPTFRDDLFADYKSTRQAMPDTLRVQIEPLHELIRGLGLPILSVRGVEADDVIGTLATQAAAASQPVLIVSGDKDFTQLVNDSITLVDTMKGITTGSAEVVAQFGVRPEQIVDYLTLVGDKADHVPGVRGVGEKIAAQWLNHYQTLDNLLAHAESISGRVGENLRAAREQIALSKQLVTIRRDLELELSWEQLLRQPPDRATLQPLYQRFEFKSWLKELTTQPSGASQQPRLPFAESELSPAAIQPSPPNASGFTFHYDTITTRPQLEAWLNRLQQAAAFAFDTETTSLNYLEARLVGLSFALTPEEAAYIPLGHTSADGVVTQLDTAEVLQMLRPLLESERIGKIGQNLKYDSHVLLNHGITLRGIVGDTMLQSYLLDSGTHRHDLDTLAFHYLGYQTVTYEDLTGKGVKAIPFAAVPLAEAAHYAAEDAAVTLALQQQFTTRLEEQPQLYSLYRQLELPLLGVLLRMERQGVLIDTDLLRQQSIELGAALATLESQMVTVAGEPFNPASPKQIQAILYDKLHLPVLKKTPKGQPSTAEEVLQELALDYELPRLLLDHRSLAKLKSTYTEKLPLMVNPTTGRVHTSYHQAVAATGRLSSADPNLQNIPIRSREGRRIRQAFRAPEGYGLLAADYSQIELRIMAHLSNDPALLHAFAQGADIHRATAAELAGIPLESVTTEQRRRAKAVNFGLIYGMSAFGLAKQLGLDRLAAQEYIDLYFNRYPGVKAYMDRTREQARQQGFVETIFGRRLYLPEINASNAQRRQYAERTAINAPMQGSAADLIKRAMVAVDQWLMESHSPIRMVMQVHDELVFEVPLPLLAEATAAIQPLMEQVADLQVPLRVEIGSGSNWDEAH